MASPSDHKSQERASASQRISHASSNLVGSQLKPGASSFVAGSPEHALAVSQLAQSPTTVAGSSTVRPNRVEHSGPYEQIEQTTTNLNSVAANLDRMRAATTVGNTHSAVHIHDLHTQRRQLISHYSAVRAHITELESRRERENQGLATMDASVISALDASIKGREDEAHWLKNEKERLDEEIEEAYAALNPL